MKKLCLVIMAGLLVVSGFACATITPRSSVQVNHPYASYSVNGAGTNEETINALGKYKVFTTQTGVIIEQMGRQIQATPGVRYNLSPDHLIIEGGQPVEKKFNVVLKNGSQANLLAIEFYRVNNTDTRLDQTSIASGGTRTYSGLSAGSYLVKGKFMSGKKIIKDFSYQFFLNDDMSFTFSV
ncbi:MAG: hypothetical protein NT116_00820 [Candidatus Parcubacteria bacterium]|nr:hypothetical protein [Candidatus Parcubacteria bacterium]